MCESNEVIPECWHTVYSAYAPMVVYRSSRQDMFPRFLLLLSCLRTQPLLLRCTIEGVQIPIFFCPLSEAYIFIYR